MRILPHRPAFPKATALFVAAFLLLGVPLLHAQVAVYKLVLKADATASVNLAVFERAYLAVDFEEGHGTLFFLGNGDASAAEKFFIEAPDAMQVYTAFDSDETAFLVIRSFAKNRTAQSAYVATGRLDLSLDIGENRPSQKLARTLNGVFTSTDDESDLRSAPTDGSLGVGGFGSLVATLEKDRTEEAIRTGKSYADVVSAIRESLVDLGFENLTKTESDAETATEANVPQEPTTGPAEETGGPSQINR